MCVSRLKDYNTHGEKVWLWQRDTLNLPLDSLSRLLKIVVATAMLGLVMPEVDIQYLEVGYVWAEQS